MLGSWSNFIRDISSAFAQPQLDILEPVSQNIKQHFSSNAGLHSVNNVNKQGHRLDASFRNPKETTISHAQNFQLMRLCKS